MIFVTGVTEKWFVTCHIYARNIFLFSHDTRDRVDTRDNLSTALYVYRLFVTCLTRFAVTHVTYTILFLGTELNPIHTREHKLKIFCWVRV